MNWSELSFITSDLEQIERLMENRKYLFILGCHCPQQSILPFPGRRESCSPYSMLA